MPFDHVQLLHFADDPKLGCGANLRFANGEPCMLSIAQSGILVKKSRFGLLGAVLYEEKNAYINAQRTGALAYLFPNKRFPDGISSPNLRAFLNAILYCKDAAQVSETLNRAIELAEKRAGCKLLDISPSAFPEWSRPPKPEATQTKRMTADEAVEAVGRLGELIERYPLAIFDSSRLPLPKSQMKQAIKGMWKALTVQDAGLREHLAVGYMHLSHFQDGVGDKPIEPPKSANIGTKDVAKIKAWIGSDAGKAYQSGLEVWTKWQEKAIEESKVLSAEFDTWKRSPK
jgi:hypothetical protein